MEGPSWHGNEMRERGAVAQGLREIAPNQSIARHVATAHDMLAAAMAHPAPKLIATVTKRGNSVGNDNHYELRTPHLPTREQIVEAQIGAGFHPAGYGGPSGIHIEERVREDRPAEFVTTWTSQGSAD